MHQDRINKKLKKEHYKMEHKHATLAYKTECTKAAINREYVGKSANKIADETRLLFGGVGPDKRAITRYCNEYNLVGHSPIKPGNKGRIPHHLFQSACIAFESFISINQVNGTCSENRRQILSKRLNGIFGIKPFTHHPNHSLLKRVSMATSADLDALKSNNVEQRRIQWTMRKKLGYVL